MWVFPLHVHGPLSSARRPVRSPAWEMPAHFPGWVQGSPPGSLEGKWQSSPPGAPARPASRWWPLWWAGRHLPFPVPLGASRLVLCSNSLLLVCRWL